MPFPYLNVLKIFFKRKELHRKIVFTVSRKIRLESWKLVIAGFIVHRSSPNEFCNDCHCLLVLIYIKFNLSNVNFPNTNLTCNQPHINKKLNILNSAFNYIL